MSKVLRLFFGYQRPEITQFRKTVRQFTTDLPAVRNALRDMVDAALYPGYPLPPGPSSPDENAVAANLLFGPGPDGDWRDRLF